MKTCGSFWKRSVGAGAVLLMACGSAGAGIISATLEDFTNGLDGSEDNFRAVVTLDDTAAADVVAITVDIRDLDPSVSNSGINDGLTKGDILGIFFNIAEDFGAPITVVDGSAFGSDTTNLTVSIGTGRNATLGNSGGKNESVQFDIAFGIGVQGSPEGFNQRVGFSLTAAGLSNAVFVNQQVGARVQSIEGSVFSATSDSSKLKGVLPGDGEPNPVSSPGTLALAGAGLLGFGFARRRRNRHPATPAG